MTLVMGERQLEIYPATEFTSVVQRPLHYLFAEAFE